MSGYTVYNSATGEILRSGECPDDMVYLQAQNETETVLPFGSNDAVNYVDLTGPDPVIAEKTPLPYSITGNVISGLPTPTRIRAQGPLTDDFEVLDGELEFAPPAPGTYRLTLTSGVMYLPAVVELEIG